MKISTQNIVCSQHQMNTGRERKEGKRRGKRRKKEEKEEDKEEEKRKKKNMEEEHVRGQEKRKDRKVKAMEWRCNQLQAMKIYTNFFFLSSTDHLK